MNSLVLHGYIEAWYPRALVLLVLIGAPLCIRRNWNPQRHPMKLFVAGFTFICFLLWHERCVRGHRELNRDSYVMFSNDGPLGSQVQDAAESSIRPVNAADYAIVLIMWSAVLIGGIFIWKECDG